MKFILKLFSTENILKLNNILLKFETVRSLLIQFDKIFIKYKTNINY